MLRLIGILIGSSLAIGLLIVTLGVPQFSDPEPAHAGGGSPATETAPAPVPVPVASDFPATEPDPAPATTGVDGGLPVIEPDTEALIDQIFSPDTQPALAGAPEPDPEPAIEENWYAFWSPFRSELAANGFISRLQETTGIDYRVVKVKTGVYEVAFAYTDDADAEDKLSRISAATGLDMSGG